MPTKLKTLVFAKSGEWSEHQSHPLADIEHRCKCPRGYTLSITASRSCKKGDYDIQNSGSNFMTVLGISEGINNLDDAKEFAWNSACEDVRIKYEKYHRLIVKYESSFAE